MKIANTADWHIRGKDLDACREQLAALVMECVRQEVKLLCVGGDVFERSTIGDNHASTGAIAAVAIHAVKELTKHGIQVLMIPGNHDQSGAGSADALHVFDGMEGVYIERIPAVRPVAQGKSSVIILCLPWSWEGGNPEECLGLYQNIRENTDASAKIMLLSHIQVIGSRMSGSFTCEPKPGAWQVSRAFLESLPVDHIALGDFHARQELVPGKGGYVGALRQCNFGEENNPAGFEIWDSETNQTEWVELDAAPRHITYKCPDGVLSGEDHPHCGNGYRIRYQVEGQPDPAEVARLESQGVQIEQILDRQERVSRAEVPEGAIQNPHALIDLWAGVQNPPIEPERLAQLHAGHDRLFADKAPVISPVDKPLSQGQEIPMQQESGALPF